ncbi:MAG: hypothetical protein JSW50_14205, partial [Candidatus Latescibacterota bacterium]
QALVEPAWSARHNLVSILNFGVTLPFFVLGVVLAVKDRRRESLMLTLVVVAFFLMRTYLGANERIRIPIDPLIILVGVYGIASVVGYFTTPKEEA